MIAATSEELKRKLEKETGSLVSSMLVHWERYLQSGVHVDITVGRWRGKRVVKWQDLGLSLDKETEKEMNKLFQVRQSLLPQELEKELLGIERALRKNVSRNSILIFGDGDKRGINFSPVTMYATLKEEHEQLAAKYQKIRNDIAGTDEAYDNVRNQTSVSLRIAAASAYNNLLKVDPKILKTTNKDEADPITHWVDGEEIMVKDLGVFCDQYVTSALKSFPSREDLFRSFSVHLSTKMIPTPSMLEQDLLNASKIRLEREKAHEEAQIENKNRHEWLENLRAIRENRLQTANAIRRTKVTEAELHEEKLLEMKQDAIRQLRQQTTEQVDELVASIIKGLCEPMYEKIEHIVNKLDGKDKMHGRLVDSANKALQRAESIVEFIGTEAGEEMITMMDTVKRAIGNPDSRDIEDVKSKLLDFSLVVREELRNVNSTPRLNLPISETPDIGEVTAAKRRLGVRNVAVPDLELTL